MKLIKGRNGLEEGYLIGIIEVFFANYLSFSSWQVFLAEAPHFPHLRHLSGIMIGCSSRMCQIAFST